MNKIVSYKIYNNILQNEKKKSKTKIKIFGYFYVIFKK